MRPIVTYIPRGVVPRTAHLLLHGVVRGAARSGAAYFYTQPSAAWRGPRPIVTYISRGVVTRAVFATFHLVSHCAPALGNLRAGDE